MIAQGQINTCRYWFAGLYARSYILARRFEIDLQQDVAQEVLVLAKKSEEEMFGIDARRAEVTGFVTSEEHCPPSAFCVTLKHEINPGREELSHAQFVRCFQYRAAFPADDCATVSADKRVGDFLCAAGAV